MNYLEMVWPCDLVYFDINVGALRSISFFSVSPKRLDSVGTDRAFRRCVGAIRGLLIVSAYFLYDTLPQFPKANGGVQISIGA